MVPPWLRRPLQRLRHSALAGAGPRAPGAAAAKVRPVFEELEPRLLYSADHPLALLVGPAAAHVMVVPPAEPSPPAAVVTTAAVATVPALTPALTLANRTVSAPVGTATASTTLELLFVDAGVADAQALIDAATAARSPGTSITVVTLDARHDGLVQISQALAQQAALSAQPLSAIHIVSHGSAGALQLGSTRVDGAMLAARSGELNAWAAALSGEADILLYGCDVAAGAQGQAFVQQLARLTGADVAASDNTTGSAAQGADVTLEFAAGAVQATPLLGASSPFAATLGLTVQGTETRVNSATTGTQETTDFGGGSVAMDASGNTVVVYTDLDVNSGDVYAQRFNSSGVAQGAAILVNSTTNDVQKDASVAMASDGRFVVTWSSFGQDLASTYGVYARTFAADGTATSAELAVNTSTTGDQRYAKVGMDDSGNFVVAFGDYNSTSCDVYVQRYNAAGVAQGANFRANTTTSSAQLFPDISVHASTGDFVVVWESDAQDGSSNGVYGQRYNASGVAQGAEFQLHTTTTNVQESAKVAHSPDGSFAVAWESAAGATVDFIVRRFDASGTALGGELIVNTTTANSQRWGDLAFASASSLLVTWGSDLQDGGGYGVYAQAVNAYSGLRVGAELRVSTSTTNAQQFPSLAANGSQAMVVWRGNGTVAGQVDSAGVFMQRFSTAPATFTVSNTNNAGAGSLRQAITDANASPGLDNISFNISGTGVHTIAPTAVLPDITDPVNLDATTDDSFAVNGSRPAVVVAGNAAGLGVDGVTLAPGASGSTLRGLVVRDWGADGISIQSGSNNNLIVGNYIGRLTSSGTDSGASTENDGSGIYVQGANNTIGGTTAADRNVIAGNDYGIELVGATANNNLISGNYIGTLATGSTALANTLGGVRIHNAPNNTVGRSATGAGNVISGNVGYGVWLNQVGSTGNTVAGNLIGLNAAGTSALGNSNDGIAILDGASSNTIGGATTAHRNVIAANADGVQIGGAAGGANSNIIRNNYIGTDSTGTVDLGNNDDGVDIDNAALNNQVLDNLLSGNSNQGIDLGDAGASTGTVIQGNLIGTAANGSSALGNGNNGIMIGNGGTANNTTIGGTSAGQGNTIAFNGDDGIFIPASTSVAILGNSIYSNSGLGIDLGTNGVTANDANDVDTGANNLQNFPVLTSATVASAGTTVVGSFNSNASTNYRIEFFGTRPSQADGTGYGEAERYLGFINVTTNGSGNASVNTTLTDVWVNHLDRVTATATVDLGGGNYGSTSEFALNVIASASGVVVVDTTSDVSDGTVTSISNLANARGADGRISLREAIAATNATAGTDTIVFNIGGGGAQTITLGSSLPLVTGAVVLDARTQGGYAGTPLIRLDGNAAAADGLNLSAGSSFSTVAGFAIVQATSNNLVIESSSNTIVANYFGTDGAVGLGSTVSGIYISPTGSSNQIGSTSTSDRNLFGASTQAGITANGSGDIIQGNWFGLAADGVTPISTGGSAILISSGSTNNLVGGTAAGAGNRISNSGGRGLFVFNSATVGNALLGNSISGNSSLGIDLGAGGVTANDAGDGDTGSNNLQNFPVLTTARTNVSNQLILTGTFNSTANSYFRIEFFANTSQDSTGYGEGQTYLGFANVATDGSGNATISTTLTVNVAVGSFISATATRSNITYTAFTDTSEFARNIAAVSSTQAVVTVDTGADTSDGDTTSLSALLANKGADGFVSLREAITAANNTPNGTAVDVIQFNIAGGGIQTINVGAAGLPSITNPVLIDGWSQAGYTSTPVLQLNGGNGGASVEGFMLAAGSSGSTVRGFIINRFTGNGIEINNSNNHTLQGNWIGLNSAGSAASANGDNGIYVTLSSGNLIGGSTAATRNTIAGNTNRGIYFIDGDSSTISGNYVGTDVTGLLDLNGSTLNLNQTGIVIATGSSGNTVGGLVAGAGNLVSGNNHYGIELQSASQNNLLQGNYVGTTLTGLAARPNVSGGVSLWGAGTGNVVGGSASGARNVLSGNSGIGVLASNANAGGSIQGNFIGLGMDGSTALGNTTEGIHVSGAATNLLIGTNADGSFDAAERNVISSNAGSGIVISGVGTTGILVQGNYVGLDATGALARGNAFNGVGVYNGATGNTIGGFAVGAGNVLSANGDNGVGISDVGTSNNLVLGNNIGLNAAQSATLGNVFQGVWIGSGATNNLVGGTTAAASNIVTGSTYAGIEISGASSTGNALLGNRVYGNSDLGIDLGGTGLTLNDAGDADAGANNLQNFPVLATALTNASSQIVLTGTLNSTASSYYRIEFFASTSADATGYGEGETYLGFANVATDGSGNANISTTLAVNVPAGAFISATATRSNAAYTTFTDSSEFAQNVTATTATIAPVVTTTGSTLAYTENSAATAVDPGLTLSDVDSATLWPAPPSASAPASCPRKTSCFSTARTASAGNGTLRPACSRSAARPPWRSTRPRCAAWPMPTRRTTPTQPRARQPLP